jgi:diguanylate cyclase (GGDEF)-like protein
MLANDRRTVPGASNGDSPVIDAICLNSSEGIPAASSMPHNPAGNQNGAGNRWVGSTVDSRGSSRGRKAAAPPPVFDRWVTFGAPLTEPTRGFPNTPAAGGASLIALRAPFEGAPDGAMTEPSVKHDKPVSVLVVDPDRTMGQSHCRVLREHGHDCRAVAGVTSALAALEEGPVDWVVVGLHKRRAARELLRSLAERPAGSRGFTHIAGVRFADDPPRAWGGLSAVLIQPTPPAALAAIVAPAPEPPTIDMGGVSTLLASHSLGPIDEALLRAADGLVSALGVAAAGVVMDTPRVAVVVPALGDDQPKMVQRLLAAATSQAPLVFGALATKVADQPYEEAFESLVAAAAGGTGHRPRIVIGVAVRGAHRRLGELKPVLRALAERIAEERAVEAVRDRLAAELDAVREVGGLDPMLGVWNRGTLTRLLAMMETACRRGGQSIAVAVINVSGMTRINDVYGHREGDALLRHVAEVAVYVVRGSDIVARYQGDDLAVVFPGATAPEAARVVGRIRRTIESQPVRTDDGQEIAVTTTAGVSAVEGEDDGERAMARAAKAAASGTEHNAVVTAFFDGAASEEPAVVTRRSLDGITFGGTYRVLHEIGAGGGGGVFRGEDLGLRRSVAIKVLRAEQSQNEDLVERFRGEAATLAALRHPNLVQVYAFGLEDGHAYFVMELVEGESLFDAVSRGRREGQPVPVKRIKMVLEQITSALRTLHDAGIIHRDVKPANVLIDPFRDRAVLVDVGIASRRGERTSLAGTPGYMAPEAAASVDLDVTADVYGLAVTLYELLTLDLPWPVEDDPLSTIRNQTLKTPTPPSHFDRAFVALDAPLLKAISVHPSERFRSVDAFATAMHEALESLVAEPSAETEPAPESDPDGVRSSPVVWRAKPEDEEPNTRGVVFRVVPRVVGAREAGAWRLELGASKPRLAEALSPATLPLGWLPTRLLVELMASPPTSYPEPSRFGRDLGRAAVRATFRRFFPASSATLAPTGTMSALPSIWARYHSWGTPSVIQHRGDAVTVLIRGTLREPLLCDWVQGAFEQLVVLSGGDGVEVTHERCEARGDAECSFDVRYKWDPSSQLSWRPT